MVRNRLIRAVVVGALAVMPLIASATMTDEEARAAVDDAVRHGTSADAIIEMLRQDGHSLEEATVLAVSAVQGPTQSDLARAGICAAVDIQQAEKVGNAVLEVATPGSISDQIKTTIDTYATTGCLKEEERRPPPSHTPTNTGSGGGINPLRPGSPSS